MRQTAQADLRRLVGGDGPIQPAEGEAAHGMGTSNVPLPRPERRALDRRLEAARQRERAVRAAAKPHVSLGGGYDYARPNPRIFPRADRWEDSWDASVNVSWTLWDGGRRAAEQAEAAALARAVAARIDDFDRQAGFEVQARQLEVESSRAAMDAAQEGIEAAVEARRVLGERYRAGVATSTEVLDAEVAVLQAQLDRTRAVASLRLAEARLARASGSLR
jgi:outer membrane protein TolC